MPYDMVSAMWLIWHCVKLTRFVSINEFNEEYSASVMPLSNRQHIGLKWFVFIIKVDEQRNVAT